MLLSRYLKILNCRLKMIYTKTTPNISYDEFFKLIVPVKSFSSLTGKPYQVLKIEGSEMSFVRNTSGVQWKMDLKEVHQAYLLLTDFKTINFKTFVKRTHSPALGLLLHLGLLVK